MIEKTASMSITRQTSLLCVSKSSYYHKPVYSDDELEVMEQIDAIYTEHCYYGSRRMSKELQYRWYAVGRKKARRYMQIMGIYAIYPPPKTSIGNKQHTVFPYLLKDMNVMRPNQVRSTDITYIKIPWWFVYLVAIIDRYSRYIVTWDVGIMIDAQLCIWVLQKALHIAKPTIFNTDQWSQFTSKKFVQTLQTANIQISMDGQWRCYDNIAIERLWRTIKYEDIYINDYQTPLQVYEWLSKYIEKYNTRRLHSALDYKTPQEVYLHTL